MITFVLHNTKPGVYAFNTRGVRKWIIGEKDLNLKKNSSFESARTVLISI
jgi:hypothetical protein